MSTTIKTATVTRNGNVYTFNTATTLREELAKLRAKGADVIETLKGFKVAYLHNGELGRDDCDYITIGTFTRRDGKLDFVTGLGSGQPGNIDSDGRVTRRNSRHSSYPAGADLYIEASYFASGIRLGRVKVITLEQALGSGATPDQIVEDYYFGVAEPDSLETLELRERGGSDKEKVSVEGHFYNARFDGLSFRIGDWFIADNGGRTASAIETSAGSSTSRWTVVLLSKSGDTGFTAHMPLSEMTLEDARASLAAVGTITDIKFYLGRDEQSLTVRTIQYDSDAQGNGFTSMGDWYGDASTKKAVSLALTNESTLETFGRYVWLDAETVQRYAPAYYGHPGGDFAAGTLIATPDARILRVVEVTEKFIIAQHPAGHGETVALPITEGVEYKHVDESVAASIL